MAYINITLIVIGEERRGEREKREEDLMFGYTHEIVLMMQFLYLLNFWSQMRLKLV